MTLKLSSEVQRIRKDGEELTVLLKGGEQISVDRVVFAPGVRPRSSLAEIAGLNIGENGGILVDSRGRTSDLNIYACGDCAEHPGIYGHHLLPLGSIANRQGRVVANVIAGKDDSIPILHGSSVVKVFDLTVAVCGPNENWMKARNITTESYWGTFPDRAHYYPESEDVVIKMVRERAGRLAGIQAVGKGEESSVGWMCSR